MPLNIDWQQILLHAFNFIILAAGLTFLLFKPVRKFMQERQEKYRKTAEEHARKQAELSQLDEEKNAKIASMDSWRVTERNSSRRPRRATSTSSTRRRPRRRPYSPKAGKRPRRRRLHFSAAPNAKLRIW